MKVTFEKKNHVAWITINRPDVHNCIDGDTATLLNQAFEEYKRDDDLYVAVLTGSGEKSFSSGADLKAIDTLGPEDQYDASFVYDGAGYLGFTRLDVQKPTIAAINGYCFAGGLEMAAWCDIRIASETATFGCLERRWNVPLVDGGTQRLPRILGWGRGMDMIISGRKIDAPTALEWGLVTEVTPAHALVERAEELANQIASYPQSSLRSDRQAAVRGWGGSMEEGLRIECQLGMPHVNSPETVQGLNDFVNRKQN